MTFTVVDPMNANNPSARNVTFGPAGLTWAPNTPTYNDVDNVVNEISSRTNATGLRFRNGANEGAFTVTIDVTCPAGFTG